MIFFKVHPQCASTDWFTVNVALNLAEFQSYSKLITFVFFGFFLNKLHTECILLSNYVLFFLTEGIFTQKGWSLKSFRFLRRLFKQEATSRYSHAFKFVKYICLYFVLFFISLKWIVKNQIHPTRSKRGFHCWIHSTRVHFIRGRGIEKTCNEECPFTRHKEPWKVFGRVLY